MKFLWRFFTILFITPINTNCWSDKNTLVPHLFRHPITVLQDSF